MSDFKLAKTYDFKDVESRIYKWWEESGYFTPEVQPGVKPYVISMPPPNVTGEMHIGHAMFVAIEDLMIRHSRMSGIPTLWLPGTDHAGIATQLQVEKYLLRTDEVTREEIGREAFVQKTWEWKEKYGGIITQQLRRLGASCDWTRERFTRDEGLSAAVLEAFVRLYEKGYIYRGTYLINWSPGLQTAVSDLEVEYHEEQGFLYYFKYRVEGTDENIPVATTRPETILGDTAVAIHPEDKRYQHLIGKTCLVPILDRQIPIIADDYVDLEFGTGALKITPGHDPADYEIGQRHSLKVINILNADATMNDAAGPYAGLDRFECRKKLWADMEAQGLTLKTEPYTLQIPRSQRGGEVVEPMVSTQWFVRMESLAAPALEAVRSGQIQIVPERFEKVYYNWLENIRDWCISRQLWWGHRIPAWHCADCGEITVAREVPTQCTHCESSAITQDPDVLDTWFSSGLWPFSTLGWPDDTEDLRYFFPTTMMETGYDILFFWVARMIMMSLEFTGEIPFEVVYLHGLVRVSGGQKMSKSYGNVVDPLELMEEFGTDALRFTLLTGSTPGQDSKMNLEKLEAHRNFANKLWNVGRLIMNAVEREPSRFDEDSTLSNADRWILCRLAQIQMSVDRLFAAYQYGEAGRQLYEFFWGEFADWYLEIAKLQLDGEEGAAGRTTKIMAQVYDACLRMLHPFMPFVTEELWGHLKRTCVENSASYEPVGSWEEALIVARWPTADESAAQQAEDVEKFQVVMDIVKAVRNARLEKGVELRRRIPAAIQAGNAAEYLASSSAAIAALAGIDSEQLQIEVALDERPENALALVIHGVEIYLPLEGLLDLELEKERLQEQLAEAVSQQERIEKLLTGAFAERAPEDVVEKERAKLRSFEETAEKIKQQLETLS
ncbi:MAG: valine--tRNA ligase [Anaerolineales bacterium]|nr:MAG: valine--tRNA ligase [Anaerolineales bacterium]